MLTSWISVKVLLVALGVARFVWGWMRDVGWRVRRSSGEDAPGGRIGV